jgi:hypothetical protein
LAVTIDLRKLRQPIFECFGGLLVGAHAVGSRVIIVARSLFSLPFAICTLHFAVFNLRPFAYPSKHLRRLQSPTSAAFSLGIPGRVVIRPHDSATPELALLACGRIAGRIHKPDAQAKAESSK